MTRNCRLAALALTASIITGLFAQETRLPPPPTPATPIQPGLPPAPPGTNIVPAVPFIPAPPTIGQPTIPNAVQPYLPQRTLTLTVPAPPVRPASRETYTGPAKVSLDDGTALTGEIHADGPLDCVASFGPIAVPFDKIRGILWREPLEGQGPQGLQATLALEHNDTLTVTMSCPAIRMKTSWGEANVELQHVRSLLLTTDKVRWGQTPDGRRVLMPESDAAPSPPSP